MDAPVSADSMDAMWGTTFASYDADCGGFANDLRKQVLYGVEVVDRDTLKPFFVDGVAVGFQHAVYGLMV